MDRRCLNPFFRLLPDQCGIVTIRCYDSYIIRRYIPDPGKNLCCDYISLPLIGMAMCETDSRSADKSHGILFAIIFCHYEKLIIIEFLIAESDYLRMTPVMLPQKRIWNRRKEPGNGKEETA